MPLLFRELSADIVVAGLERMKRGSAPGMDGIPAEVYPDHRCSAAADSTGAEGFFTGTAHGRPHCVCTVGVGTAPRANHGGSRFSKGI